MISSWDVFIYLVILAKFEYLDILLRIRKYIYSKFHVLLLMIWQFILVRWGTLKWLSRTGIDPQSNCIIIIVTWNLVISGNSSKSMFAKPWSSSYVLNQLSRGCQFELPLRITTNIINVLSGVALRWSPLNNIH